jgi:hypothetical protein
MAGFQFGHISTFSFKGNTANFSIDEVAAEAARLPGSHPHVAEPLPPTLLAGHFTPEQVPDEIRRRVTEAKTALKGVRTADGKIQRIRDDTHVMEAQVHSHPIYTKAPPAEHQGEDRPSMDDPLWRNRYLNWRSELVRWIDQDARRRGLDMLCVVEHLDEAHPHIHALLVPRRTKKNPRIDAKATHPGHAAQARRRAQARERLTSAVPIRAISAEAGPTRRTGTRRRRGTDIGRRNSAQPKKGKARRKAGEPASLEQIINQVGTRAYKAAMRGWQSHLYETHSFRHGLARIGPGLERLSRRAWWQRQTDSEAVLGQKELATTLATVADNFTGEARVADERRRNAEAEAANLRGEIETLKAELAAAHETIRHAEELPQTIRSLEVQEASARERLAGVSAEVDEAELKLKQAHDAEAARKEAESAAAEAEKRRQEAESAVTLLQRREEHVSAELERIGQRETAVKAREKNVMAKLRGMAAWANGRLGLDTDGRLVILEPKPGRNADHELASLRPAESWLIDAVKRLDSLFSDRLARALDQVKKVIASTIRAWSEGLIYRTTAYEHGVGLRKDTAPDAAREFQEDTFHHRDVVYSTLPLLPDLATVHEVMKRAEETRTMLDAAELRELNSTAAKLRGLRGRGPDQP